MHMNHKHAQCDAEVWEIASFSVVYVVLFLESSWLWMYRIIFNFNMRPPHPAWTINSQKEREYIKKNP